MTLTPATTVAELITEIRAKSSNLPFELEVYVCSGNVCLITESVPSELSSASICDVQIEPWLTLQLTVAELHAVLCRSSTISAYGALVIGAKTFIRLHPLSPEALSLCLDISSYLEPASKALLPNTLLELSARPIPWKNGDVITRLSQEPSPINLALALAGCNDEFNPPHAEEVCLELTFPGHSSEHDITSVVAAYLYQMSLRGFDFKPSGPPARIEELKSVALPPSTGKQLDVGATFMEASIQPLIKYYAKGVERQNDLDFEFAFLNFYKVLEHACGVIMLRTMNDWIKDGSRTVRALKSMSSQLSDDTLVVALIRDLRLPGGVQQGVRDLVGNHDVTLATILSSTRNYYSHAKAGYPLRGSEILEPEIKDGCALIRDVAEKVINWYSELPSSEKLTE